MERWAHGLYRVPWQRPYGRLCWFVVVLGTLFLPIAGLLYGFWGEAAIPLMGVLLYVLFAGHLWAWGYYVVPTRRPFADYGLPWQGQLGLELARGWLLGTGSLGILLGTHLILGWQAATVVEATTLGKAVLAGLGTGLAVAVIEELLFRGWLLAELALLCPRTAAFWWSSGIFAILHFLKPLEVILATWVQFPGLMLLGLALAWSKRASGGRLGWAIGLHGGLVWVYYIVNTTGWIVPTGVAPEWVTGIGRNPLAGGTGLLVLGAIALYFRQQPYNYGK
ncbi:MAG: CPBP family intramembrane metalloprotease [Oscillatoriales cyanobacterium SM2_2_1]|nr:CPBP family intramembrane metalloprotease [Oscillatoriales cyanobacterium SM2_2_1]